MFYKLGDREPHTRGEYFVAPGCHIIGSVVLGNNVSIWFNTVIRGDNDWICIGDNANIQDGCVLHADPGKPVTVGRNVTVGHKAMLHGCTIGDDCLIGINSVILNGARIGNGCLIGANTLIPENVQIPDGSMVLGSPGKIVRQVTPEQLALFRTGADLYAANGERFRRELEVIDG